MGFPLSSVLADIVLQDLEEMTSRLPIPLPLYFHYVDDIILAAPPSFFSSVLNTFNPFHKRLQFTIEISNDNCINFLDVTIKLNGGIFLIDWYRKPTFSGRFLNFHSQHPTCHKRRVIIGLVDKIFRLSHPQFHDKNLKLIVNILINNDYSINFIFTTIRKRIKFLISKDKNLCPPSRSPPLPFLLLHLFLRFLL